MTEFEKYTEAHLPDVISIFRSNVPVYFLEKEEQDLIVDIPDFKDTYFIMRVNGTIAGAGGYALNDDDTVALCWGMVHQKYHKLGFGKALLQFRMAEIANSTPAKPLCIQPPSTTLAFLKNTGLKR